MLRLLVSTMLLLGTGLVMENTLGEYTAPTLNYPVIRDQQLTDLINSLFTTERSIGKARTPLFVNPNTLSSANLPVNPLVSQNQHNNLNSFVSPLFTTERTMGTIHPTAMLPINQQQYPSDRTTMIDLPPGVPMEDNCDDGEECVIHYQCLNNTIITNGESLIDFRFSTDKPRKCRHYLEVCCRIGNKVDGSFVPISYQTSKPVGCGYRNTDGIGYRVLGNDNEAQYGEFPWMVAIIKEQRAGNKMLAIYQCGGSLIHPQVVLTAAHCTHGRAINSLKIRAGEWDTQTKNEMYPEQTRNVADIIVHPDYYRGALYNDISLLILSAPVDLEANVQTVCLPPQHAVFDHSRCTASGWGKDVFGSQGRYQVILKKIELPVVPRTTCQFALRRTRLGQRFNLHESFMCAGGEPGKDTCKGDGGSPLVCPIANEPDRYYQSGIVAWGIGCGENQLPGVYVNVALFRNWIDQQFAQRALNTSYYTAS